MSVARMLSLQPSHNPLRRQGSTTCLSQQHKVLQDWLPDEVQAAGVLFLAELFQDVAALRVEDAHGLGEVVALHHAALAAVQAG